MSGPKKSRWQIQQEAQERLRKQREEQRKREQKWIQSELSQLQSIIQRLVQRYKALADNMQKTAGNWVKEIEELSKSNFVSARSSAQSLRSYLANQEDILQDLEAKRLKEEELARLERLRQEAAKAAVRMHLGYFEDVQKEYPMLISEGVRQRIEIFKDALSVNHENQQTIRQIEDFKAQFAQIVEEHEMELAKRDYMKKSLEEVFGGSAEEGPGGEFVIQGNMDGVRITASIRAGSDEIHFDTPDDGSCKQAMQTIQSRLADNGIKLGPIHIQRTGEVIHSHTDSHDNRQRIRQ